MTINSPAAPIWAMYIVAAEKAGVPPQASHPGTTTVVWTPSEVPAAPDNADPLHENALPITDALTADSIPPQARKEHRRLAEVVEDARWRYYVLDAPTLSDADFDRRCASCEALEEQHPSLRTPDSRPRRSVARCRRSSPRWTTSSG